VQRTEGSERLVLAMRRAECTRQEFGVRPGQSAQHPEIPTTLKAGGPGCSFVELIYYGSGNVFGGQGMQLILRCNEIEVVSRRRIEAEVAFAVP
jgi:hypothetical protein